jgi:hypothetical protein
MNMNFKKGLILFLLAMAFSVCISQGVFAATGISGDVNDNGTVDIVDALLVAQYYVGLNPYQFNLTQADVNDDWNIDIVDSLLISRYYIGLISGLPYTTCHGLLVSPDIVMVSPGASGTCYPTGTVVTLSAPAHYSIVPPPGTIIIGGDYYFSNWKDSDGNNLGTQTTITIVMDKKKSIIAVYTQVY